MWQISLSEFILRSRNLKVPRLCLLSFSITIQYLERISLLHDNDRLTMRPDNNHCRIYTKFGRNRLVCFSETFPRNSCRSCTNCFQIRAFFLPPNHRRTLYVCYRLPKSYSGYRSRVYDPWASHLRTSSRGCVKKWLHNVIAKEISILRYIKILPLIIMYFLSLIYNH